jgi:hypothetical protein
MVWVKLDQFVTGNRKFRSVSIPAQCLYLKALCFCNQHRTDGHISRDQMRTLSFVSGQDVEALVPELASTALWEPDVNGDGWWVHDYAMYQPVTGPHVRDAEVERQRINRARRRDGIMPTIPEAARGPLVFPTQGMSNGRVDPKAIASLAQARRVG